METDNNAMKNTKNSKLNPMYLKKDVVIAYINSFPVVPPDPSKSGNEKSLNEVL
jgi:hypothetical protein